MTHRQSDFNLFDSLFLSPPQQIGQSIQTSGSHMTHSNNMDTMHVRKRSFSKDGSTTLDSFDDDESQDCDMKKFPRMKGFELPVGNERQNHSEIEKRRRDKMNAHISELSSMLPMCNAMNRKLDKLTVLRMAVQHLKSLRAEGATSSIPEARPSFLTEDELKHLVLEAAEGFLFVVSCDRARILYVSESVRNVLSFTRSDLIGQSLLDYLHPRDINKVKEQLSSSDMSPRERLIDAKTMMPVKTEFPQRPSHLCLGARRSFFCRMKCNNKMSGVASDVKSEKVGDIDMCHRRKKSDRKNFTVIHCTGYLKSWPSSKMDIKEQEDNDDNCNLSCLVALGQIKTPCDQNIFQKDFSSINVRPVEYVSRHSIDGKFTYVDQGATVLLGYLPQELLGTSIYEFYHQDDLMEMADIHRKVLKTKEKVKTNVYRFKSKDGSFILLRSECFSFRNPWTKDIEYIVSTNTVVPVQEVSSSGQEVEAGSLNMDLENCNWDENSESLSIEKRKMSNSGGMPGTRLGAGRIGRQIAEELIEMQRGQTSPRADSTIPVVSTTAEQRKTISSKNGINVNVPETPAVAAPTTSENIVITTKQNGLTTPACIATATATSGSMSTDTDLIENVLTEQQVLDDTVTQTNDGNDEAAMSIIMSLLEADAGLGGPIDFNDLPWPL